MTTFVGKEGYGGTVISASSSVSGSFGGDLGGFCTVGTPLLIPN
jgi:hypothetical protein